MTLPGPASRCLLAALAALAAARSALANYPIFSQRFTADPSALVHAGRVWLFCSHDGDTQTDWDMTEVILLSSDDLVNWTDHGEVFDVRRDTTWASRMWAPAVVERAGRFYLYYSNGRAGTGMAVADSPLGPWVDPLGGPLCDTGTFSDPAVLVEPDGTARLHLRNPLWAGLDASMTALATPLVGYPDSEFPDIKEGPIVARIGGRYHFSYATAPLAGYGPSYAQSVSDLPASGFRSRGKWFWLAADNEPNTHGDFFTFAGRTYFAYHNIAVALERGVATRFQRSTALDRVHFGPDGAIRAFTSTRDWMPPLRYLDPYRRVEAETLAAERFIETEPCAAGGRNLTAIEDGDWVAVRGVDFGAGATALTAAVASDGAGGVVEARLDAPDGRLVASLPVPPTGGPQQWQTVTVPASGASGVHDLYLRFSGGAGGRFNLDWWRFEGGPAAGRAPPATASPLVCLRAIGDPTIAVEPFLLLDNDDGTWSFRAVPGPGFLAVTDPVAGTIDLRPDRAAEARFALFSNPDRSFCLLAANDRFVVAGSGSLAASFDEASGGSPRLVAGGAALFALEPCATGTALDCDLAAVEVRTGTSGTAPPLAVAYGSPCLRVDPTLAEGRVAVARPEAVAGASFPDPPGPPGTLTLFQRGCGCGEALLLGRDIARGRLRIE